MISVIQLSQSQSNALWLGIFMITCTCLDGFMLIGFSQDLKVCSFQHVGEN